MYMKTPLLPFFLSAVVAAPVPLLAATGKDTVAATVYAATITAGDLSKHLHILASDTFEGRETGMPGQKRAAEYLADHFKNIGIPPLPVSGYFQPFPLVLQHPHGVTIESEGKQYEFLKDFYFFRGFGDTTMTVSDLIFLGYGIHDSVYTDYKNKDVKGKILLVLAGEPTNKKGDFILTKSQKRSEWSTDWRFKLNAAKEKGAAGVLVIADSLKKNVDKMRHYIESPSMELDTKEKYPSRRIVNFTISREMADDLLKVKKLSVDKLKKKLKNGKAFSTQLPAQVMFNVRRKVEHLSSENVLGYIEGTDKKEEVLILTAHYDHLGTDGKEIYYGADDDGTGTVALMEIAEAFAKAKKEGKGPRRSVLIMPVAGEEKGLLGSEYYTKNPIYPLEKTVADLNIDMIGRLDEKHQNNPDYVYVIGSKKLSTHLHSISEEANNNHIHIELDYTFDAPDDPNRFYYRSDHYNFARKKIPIIFYFTGVHEDYHKPTDTVDKINFPKMEKITRLVFHTAWELANRNERIVVDVKEETE